MISFYIDHAHALSRTTMQIGVFVLSDELLGRRDILVVQSQCRSPSYLMTFMSPKFVAPLDYQIMPLAPRWLPLLLKTHH